MIESRRLFLANSPLGPVIATPGHGAWNRTGNREFAATSVLIYAGAPNHPFNAGELVGTEKIRFSLKLNASGHTLAGTVLVEIRDAAVTVVFSGPGTIEATRIAVEPLS
jgi:hypothetical protein